MFKGVIIFTSKLNKKNYYIINNIMISRINILRNRGFSSVSNDKWTWTLSKSERYFRKSWQDKHRQKVKQKRNQINNLIINHNNKIKPKKN